MKYQTYVHRANDTTIYELKCFVHIYLYHLCSPKYSF